MINTTDLIDRWKRYNEDYGDGHHNIDDLYSIAAVAIAALQPVDDEEVARALEWVSYSSEPTGIMVHDLITRIHNQNRELEKINTLLLAEHTAGRKISRLSSNDSWEKWVDACDACCEIEAMSTTGEEASGRGEGG